MDIKTTLIKMTQHPNTHARWLNSLSYLEYRGLRMILRSQKTADIDDGVLTHALEEARHALYFKKLAMKVGGHYFSQYNTETLLSVNHLKSYFYNLDKETLFHYKTSAEHFENKKVYELMTWIIEERALLVYQIYDDVLRNQCFDFNLAPVLSDEAKHLDKVRSLTKDLSASKIKLQSIEENYFQIAWKAFQMEIQTLDHVKERSNQIHHNQQDSQSSAPERIS